MIEYKTKPLNSNTWSKYARLIEANNGVWGGCWCMWYHGKLNGKDDTPEVKREMKKCRVQQGQAHASLVFHGSDCVGWCQFGSPDELPRIHNQKAYLLSNTTLPDWRITCFFVGKGYRKKGVASAALAGAIAQIKTLGGGRVEGYPEDIKGRKASSAFLFNGALSMFERHGFERTRKIGKHKWVANKIIE